MTLALGRGECAAIERHLGGALSVHKRGLHALDNVGTAVLPYVCARDRVNV
jgi:hypothetical protein